MSIKKAKKSKKGVIISKKVLYFYKYNKTETRGNTEIYLKKSI